MGLAARAGGLRPGTLALVDLEIAEPLVLPEGGETTLQVIVTPEAPSGGSLADPEPRRDGSWRSHAVGRIGEPSSAPVAGPALSELRARVVETVVRVRLLPPARGDRRGLRAGLPWHRVPLARRAPRPSGRLVVPASLDRARLPHPSRAPGRGVPGDRAPPCPAARGTTRRSSCPPASAPCGSAATCRPRSWAHVSVAADGTDGVKADLRLFDDSGRTVAEISGLRLRRVRRDALERAAPRRFGEWLYELAWRPRPLAAAARTPRGTVLVLADRQETGAALAALLRDAGHRVVVATAGASFEWSAEEDRAVLDGRESEHYDRLLARTGALEAVVHAWALDAPEPGQGPLLDAQASVCGSVLSPPEGARPRRGLRGAATLPRDARRPARGRRGFHDRRRAGASLGPRPDRRPRASRASLRVRRPRPGRRRGGGVAGRDRGGDGEDQVAYRGGERHVARLARLGPRTRAGAQRATDEALRVQIAQRGILDNLAVGPTCAPRRRARDEVEIEVAAAGLNFRDVLNALGMYPGDAGLLGSECAGRVVAVGEGVSDLRSATRWSPSAEAPSGRTSRPRRLRGPDAAGRARGRRRPRRCRSPSSPRATPSNRLGPE